MAITIVQHVSIAFASGASTQSASFASNVTAGNVLLITIDINNPTTVAVSGVTIGGAADNFASAADSGFSNQGRVAIWADRGCAGGSKAVAVTTSATAGIQADAYEVSGLGSCVLDKSSTGTSAGATAWSSGATGTTTQSNELWLGGVCGGGSPTTTVAGSWTTDQTFFGLVNAHQIVSSKAAATFNGTFSFSDNYIALVAAFSAGSLSNFPCFPRQAVKRAAYY